VRVIFSARCIRGPATKLTVLSDGEDAIRLMAGQWLKGRVEHRLDWFHLSRRIQWLGRSIYWAIDYDEFAYEEKLAAYRRNLRRCGGMSGTMANRGMRDG
jgi:hypothetical protein